MSTKSTLKLTLAAFIAALSIGSAAAQSSTTPTIGYYKVDAPVGTSAWVSGFVTKSEFQGQATGAAVASGSLTITQTAAGWADDQFNGTNGAFYVEILSDGVASHQGLILDINDTTGTTVVCSAPSGFTAGSDTQYVIRKHATLGSILPGGAGLVPSQDQVAFVTPAGAIVTATYNGANWEDVGSGDDLSTSNIYPGQGFLVYNNGSGPTSVTIGGGDVSYVKNTPTVVSGYLMGINFVGVVNPLVSTAGATDVSTLLSMGLQTSMTPGVDQIVTVSSNGLLNVTGSYGFNGLNLEDVGSGDDGSLIPVRNGSAVVINVGMDKGLKLLVTHPVN